MEKEILKPRISFQDFLERIDADDRRFRMLWEKYHEKTFPPLDKTHIFHLGEDADVVKAIKPIKAELAAECREKVPMPYQDVACVSTVVHGNQQYWILDRLIESPEFRPEDPPPECIGYMEKMGLELKQNLFIMRYTEFNRFLSENIPIPMIWDVWYCGTNDLGEYRIATAIDRKIQDIVVVTLGDDAFPFFEILLKETLPILEQLAAVSHPQNYIVKVTPELTPKEKNRMSRGAPRPIRKAPHFIIVDHDILVRMNPGRGGTHASPVPHERRGHWRRLAERCRQAKLLGKTKTFVRPAYVGERAFRDEKNHYEVLLDFGKVLENT